MLRVRFPSPSLESRTATEVFGSSSWKEKSIRRVDSADGPANVQYAGWRSRNVPEFR